MLSNILSDTMSSHNAYMYTNPNAQISLDFYLTGTTNSDTNNNNNNNIINVNNSNATAARETTIEMVPIDKFRSFV